jgi:hypothetical protein
MSSWKNIPMRILVKLYELEKKFVTYPFADKIRRSKLKLNDLAENRELIVVDKHGNHYYQYYSYQGFPTKRMVHLNMYSFNKWHDEPLMQGWLQQRELFPPSQEELERRYIQQEEFQRRGIEWDKKENKLMEEYRKRRQYSIDKERNETGAKGIGEEFAPGVWDKKQLVEVKKEGKQQKNYIETQLQQVENDIPKPLGRYMVDLNAEDEKLMNIWEEKMLAPYEEVYDRVNWEDYTLEKMNERYRKEKVK